MIHTNMPRNCTLYHLPSKLTQSAILHNGVPCKFLSDKENHAIFEACLCGSLYSTLKTTPLSYAFYNKRFQMLFIDQLARYQATCHFKVKIQSSFGGYRTCALRPTPPLNLLKGTHCFFLITSFRKRVALRRCMCLMTAAVSRVF